MQLLLHTCTLSDYVPGHSVKKCVQLDPLTIPYLSPLVLRKEIENVLDQYGDACCLNSPEFIDHHPIIYWNLVCSFLFCSYFFALLRGLLH